MTQQRLDLDMLSPGERRDLANALLRDRDATLNHDRRLETVRLAPVMLQPSELIRPERRRWTNSLVVCDGVVIATAAPELSSHPSSSPRLHRSFRPTRLPHGERPSGRRRCVRSSDLIAPSMVWRIKRQA
jgi:hypothetical protein